jgi:hypothetical protein
MLRVGDFDVFLMLMPHKGVNFYIVNKPKNICLDALVTGYLNLKIFRLFVLYNMRKGSGHRKTHSYINIQI